MLTHKQTVLQCKLNTPVGRSTIWTLLFYSKRKLKPCTTPPLPLSLSICDLRLIYKVGLVTSHDCWYSEYWVLLHISLYFLNSSVRQKNTALLLFHLENKLYFWMYAVPDVQYARCLTPILVYKLRASFFFFSGTSIIFKYFKDQIRLIFKLFKHSL